ncbi:hypothetical protein TNCV_1062001 [Trichonephila clavipes]|nr:hypothetical protein TNCV_1062001 [Trichonephila clavipes]
MGILIPSLRSIAIYPHLNPLRPAAFPLTHKSKDKNDSLISPAAVKYHSFLITWISRHSEEFIEKRGRQYYCRTILDRVLGARAAGVHYRLFSVWTLVPVRRDQQLSDHSTVDEIASGAADCRLTYTMANCPQRRKRRGESQSFLFGDADQESETRMSKNALRTGRRQAVESATSKRGHHTG